MDYFKEASLGWSWSVVLPSSTLNQGNESIFSLVFVASLESVSFRFYFFFRICVWIKKKAAFTSAHRALSHCLPCSTSTYEDVRSLSWKANFHLVITILETGDCLLFLKKKKGQSYHKEKKINKNSSVSQEQEYACICYCGPLGEA